MGNTPYLIKSDMIATLSVEGIRQLCYIIVIKDALVWLRNDGFRFVVKSLVKNDKAEIGKGNNKVDLKSNRC